MMSFFQDNAESQEGSSSWTEPIFVNKSSTTITNYKKLKPRYSKKPKWKHAYKEKYYSEQNKESDVLSIASPALEYRKISTASSLSYHFKQFEKLNNSTKKSSLEQVDNSFRDNIGQTSQVASSKANSTLDLKSSFKENSVFVSELKVHTQAFISNQGIEKIPTSNNPKNQLSQFLNPHERLRRLIFATINKCFKGLPSQPEKYQLDFVFQTLQKKLNRLKWHLNSSKAEYLSITDLRSSFHESESYKQISIIIEEAIEGHNEIIPGVTELILLSDIIQKIKDLREIKPASCEENSSNNTVGDEFDTSIAPDQSHASSNENDKSSSSTSVISSIENKGPEHVSNTSSQAGIFRTPRKQIFASDDEFSSSSDESD